MKHVLVIVTRCALALCCLAALAATLAAPDVSSCHLEVRSPPGGGQLSFRCVPLQDECTDCEITGVCLMDESEYYNGGQLIKLFICLCTNEEGGGTASGSACYTAFHFNVTTGTDDMVCHENCCDPWPGCEDQTNLLIFPVWTDPCKCQL